VIETTRDTKDLRRAQYLCSAHVAHQWPQDMGYEVAFAGRSNVGKSSAINAIAGQARLARTSKTPGRTQQIVFFEIDSGRRLVDLPGYGYAKVPPALQKHWEKTVRHYLEDRNSLCGLILLADIRRGLTDLDRQLLEWCAHKNLFVHLLLTKSDKLSRSASNQTLAKVQRDVRLDNVTMQLFSALHRVGIEEAGGKVLALLRESD
jgi:GTP-binding protein